MKAGVAEKSCCVPSKREIDVLTLVARGRIDKEIAQALGVALGTVRTYRKRVQRKLGTSSTIQSVLVAWRQGHLDLERLADEAVALTDARPKR